VPEVKFKGCFIFLIENIPYTLLSCLLNMCQVDFELQKYRVEVGNMAMDHLVRILQTDRYVSQFGQKNITFTIKMGLVVFC